MLPFFRLRVLVFAALCVSGIGSAVGASAQVVIRERVEVARQPIRAEAPQAQASTYCFGPVVGYAVYTPISAWSRVNSLSGTLDVETSCGVTTATFDSFFALDGVITSGGYDRYAYVSAGPTAVLRVPLRAVESLDRQVFRSLGEEWIRNGSGGTGEFTAQFGCALYSGCTDDPPHAAETEIHRTWEGAATQVAVLQPEWPDELVCGTTAPAPLVAIRPGPTEGWLSADAQASIGLSDEGGQPAAARVMLEELGGTGPTLSVDTDYATVRMGEVSMVAPPCTEVPVPRSVKVRIAAGGRMDYVWVRLIPPPPVALDLSAERDTVWVSGPVGSRIRATAIQADSTVTMMDPTNTPITFTAVSEWLEVRQANLQQGGPTRTVPYWYTGGDDASEEGVVVRVPVAQRSGPGPVCDTPVEVTASGGGISGARTIIVAGHSTATAPDSLTVSVAPDSLAAGGVASVAVRLFTADQCDVPDSADDTPVTLSVTRPSLGELRRLDTDEAGAVLADVPYAVARDRVVFESFGRQETPPAFTSRREAVRWRGAAFSDSTSADSVRAQTWIVASTAGLASDSASVVVGGVSRLVATVVANADSTVTLRVEVPGGCTAGSPDIRLVVRGVPGQFDLPGSTPLGTEGGSVVVPCVVAEAGVGFVPDGSGGMVFIGSFSAEFVSVAYGPDGEPILPSEAVALTNQPAGGPGCLDGCEEPAAVQVQLRGVNDAPYPLGYVMVSRFPTDQRLPSGGRYSTDQYNEDPQRDFYTAELTGNAKAGDRFVVRGSIPSALEFGPEVDCKDVKFQLRVRRNGNYVTFRAGDGQQGVGSPQGEYYSYDSEFHVSDRQGQCRMNRFIRFVSNAEPGQGGSPGTANSNGGTYDDQYQGSQTVRVQLGDIVEIVAVATVGVQDVSSETLSVPVGNVEGNLTDPDTPALVNVRWATLPGGIADASVSTMRLSEDYAQVAIEFRQMGPPVEYSEVQNVFSISPFSGASSGSSWVSSNQESIGISFDIVNTDGSHIGPFNVSYEYSVGMRIETIALLFRREIAIAVAGDEDWAYGNTAHLWASSGELMVLVAKGKTILVHSFMSSSELSLATVSIPYNHLYVEFIDILRMNARAGNAVESLDIVVARGSSLWTGPPGSSPGAIWGQASSYVSGELRPDELSPVNTVVVEPVAANAPDDLPFVLGHEAGHVLIAGTEPGPTPPVADCAEWNRHSARATNFLKCGSPPNSIEGYGESKRFLDVQALQMRSRHVFETLPASTVPREPRLLRVRQSL